ncbi:MAG: hypothetical protein JW839_01610 [Candidatus Lokiarchaeota archaeon]|nr:hypothetical protein [Candidatus Lokiarchaeota archaeon]
MQGTPSTRAGNGVLWGTYISSFLIFLVMERRIFMRYLDDAVMEIAIVVVVFHAAVVAIFGGRALPTRFLALAILSSAVVLAFSWFLMFFMLADIELDYGSPEMAWAMYVQVVMLTIQIAVLPILLIEWTRRCRSTPTGAIVGGSNEAGLSIVALAVAGTLACVSGLAADLADQWAVLVGCLACAGTAASVVVLHGRMPADPGRAPLANDPGTSDANLFFRDVMLTLAIGFPGYAMMERDEFLFPTLFFAGACLAAFGVVHFLVARVRKRPGALAVLEGILIALFVATFWTMIYLYMHGMEADLIAGVPGFVTGFALGYFWTRIVHVGEGIQYPKGFPDIPRRGIGKDVTGKLVTFLLLFLLAVSVAFAISPVDPESIQYVYPVALALSSVDLFLWAVSAVKYKE